MKTNIFMAAIENDKPKQKKTAFYIQQNHKISYNSC